MIPRQSPFQGRSRFRQRPSVSDVLGRYSGSIYLPSPGSCFTDSAGTTPASKDSVVGYLRDLVGVNHATQATTGYKPILRKGAKNLLLNSATLSTQNITTAALGYTLHFTGTGTVTLSGTSTAGPLVGTGVNDRVSLSFTPTAGTLTLTVSGSVTSAQLETGSTASTYVATTSAPASNGEGLWWLDFDGTNDLLSLTSAPFQLTDDHFAVVGAKTFSLSTAVAFTAHGAVNVWAAQLRILEQAYAIWHDATAIRQSDSTGSSILGIPAIASARHTQAVSAVRKNSVAYNPKTTVIGSPAITKAVIGAPEVGAGGWYFKGSIYALALGKGTISDSELAFLERYVATLSGVTL